MFPPNAGPPARRPYLSVVDGMYQPLAPGDPDSSYSAVSHPRAPDGLSGCPRRKIPVQTIEDVITRGYLAVPDSDPAAAILTDRRDTAWFGLDDTITQVRARYEIYERNLRDILYATAAATNAMHTWKAERGWPSDRQLDNLHKTLQNLYSQERDERVTLWRDVARTPGRTPGSSPDLPDCPSQAATARHARRRGPVMSRVQELCRRLKPVLGRRVDGLWLAYLADSDAAGRADIEQTLELLAAKHLGQDYQPDRAPFPPPAQSFCAGGDIRLGAVTYAGRALYPFFLQSDRLKEHVLIAGRSGSGKTNLAFVLMQGIMDRGIKVLALDWKRSYRDLLHTRPDLRVHTIGRDLAPFRFNPLIPPPGCEPNVWIKLIVDVIAGAYLGGEGVISLLVAGLDHLYRARRSETSSERPWPTVVDLLAWLRGTKLRGRAGMWQASAERILVAMTYGEFGAVVNTQDNSHVLELLDHNVVLEMDGLSSASDRVLFSEALTSYLYRYRLAQGPRDRLMNILVLEEAHNLLMARQSGSRESVLETSIRMIRQYGLGYVFVDQSASLLSKVAFANSYATIALSQKLRADVQAMAGAMNMNDEQKEALNTLPIGTAVVRLADQHPEPFLVNIPRFPIREGSVSDEDIRKRMGSCSTDSAPREPCLPVATAIPPIPPSDKKHHVTHDEDPHPPSPTSTATVPAGAGPEYAETEVRPDETLTREAVRFVADVAARPLSTTVSRYQRLHLSRRKGNAVKADLLAASLIEAVPIATRSGQVVLYQLTDWGRAACRDLGIDAGPVPRASLEHTYWAAKVAGAFRHRGYEVTIEQPVPGDGTVDVVAERPGERVAIEIETGKSDIAANLSKLENAGFDRVLVVATSPTAAAACQRAVAAHETADAVRLQTWLDFD